MTPRLAHTSTIAGLPGTPRATAASYAAEKLAQQNKDGAKPNHFWTSGCSRTKKPTRQALACIGILKRHVVVAVDDLGAMAAGNVDTSAADAAVSDALGADEVEAAAAEGADCPDCKGIKAARTPRGRCFRLSALSGG